LINNSVMARDDMPGPLAARLAEALDRLHTSEEGRRILKAIPLSRFELADDARYRVVEDFLARFSQTVRRPEE
jgi:phosphonate transport system substrate-binding protein